MELIVNTNYKVIHFKKRLMNYGKKYKWYNLIHLMKFALNICLINSIRLWKTFQYNKTFVDKIFYDRF